MKKKGWTGQTKRHSNAKKYGCAGGIYAKPKKRYKTPVMPVELPKYMINGKFYYRDVRLGEYRNVANPTDSIPIDDVGTTNDYKYQLEKPKPKLKPSNWGVSMSVKENSSKAGLGSRGISGDLGLLMMKFKPDDVYIEDSGEEFYLRFEDENGGTIEEFPLGKKIPKELKDIEVRELN